MILECYIFTFENKSVLLEHKIWHIFKLAVYMMISEKVKMWKKSIFINYGIGIMLTLLFKICKLESSYFSLHIQVFTAYVYILHFPCAPAELLNYIF